MKFTKITEFHQNIPKNHWFHKQMHHGVESEQKVLKSAKSVQTAKNAQNTKNAKKSRKC